MHLHDDVLRATMFAALGPPNDAGEQRVEKAKERVAPVRRAQASSAARRTSEPPAKKRAINVLNDPPATSGAVQKRTSSGSSQSPVASGSAEKTTRTINVLSAAPATGGAARQRAAQAADQSPSARAMQRTVLNDEAAANRRGAVTRTWLLLAALIERENIDAITADAAIDMSRAEG